MSEMRRVARALVERRTERIESRHPLAESKRRLEDALARARPRGASAFALAWHDDGGKAVLEVSYAPPASLQRLLQAISVAMALALVAAGWAIATQEGAIAFLVPLFTVFAILGVPLVTLGLGSRRTAEEARIQKAIRVALLDEEERLPPPQRWKDED